MMRRSDLRRENWQLPKNSSDASSALFSPFALMLVLFAVMALAGAADVHQTVSHPQWGSMTGAH